MVFLVRMLFANNRMHKTIRIEVFSLGTVLVKVENEAQIYRLIAQSETMTLLSLTRMGSEPSALNYMTTSVIQVLRSVFRLMFRSCKQIEVISGVKTLN
jgi:hypothetical protein